MDYEVNDKPKNTWLCTVMICLSISSVMLSTGIAVGTFNASLDNFNFFFNRTWQYRHNGTSISPDLSTTLTAMSGSMMLAGGFIGSTGSGWILTWLGRRSSAILMNWINLVATLLMSVTTFRAYSYESFIVGRFVFGIFCGFGMNLIPLLVAESSTANRQAFYLSLIGVNLSGGGLLGLCMGFQSVLGAKELAPLLLSLSSVPSMVYLLASHWLPDSPYTLMRAAKRDAAIKTMKLLRSGMNLQNINNTLDQIRVHQSNSTRVRQASLTELFTNTAYRRILIAVLVLYIQAQLCGINGVGMYTTKIFKKADFTESGSTTATAIVYTVQFFVALLGSYAVDRYGPKRLNYISSFVMSGSLILLFIAMTFSKNVPSLKYVSVVAVTIFVLSWACGVNLTLFPMLAAYSTEATREKAFAFGGGVFWFFSWGVSFVFLYMLEGMQQYTFLPFALFNFVFGLYVLLRMPETQGRNPKEITDEIQGIVTLEDQEKTGGDEELAILA